MSSITSPIDAAVKAGLGKEEDFNLTYDRLTHISGKQYYAKSSKNVAQLLGEAEGLRKMAEAAPGLAPTVHIAEEINDGQKAVFVSDYITLGRTNAASLQKLAKRMANELHNPENHSEIHQYGFPIPTHCGVTEQDNTRENDWMVFFRDHRIGDVLKQIEDLRGASAGELLKLGREVQKNVIPKLLSDFSPPAKPVLLHGDLWSGNVATNSKTGEPVVYDCSAYYGHNEADFGISHMFGPFDSDFYKTYHAIIPRSEPNYDERQKLYELYHHLNHYLMFGGSYATSATRLMQDLISWAKQ